MEEKKKTKVTPKKKTVKTKNTSKVKSAKKTPSKTVSRKTAKAKKETVEKIGTYTEYEDFHVEKQLGKVFKFLMFLSTILSILIILKNKDVCMEVVYARCGLAYDIVNSSVFFIILWIENILAIVFCLYKIFCAILDKAGKNFIFGIIGILVQPIVWENILKALNILW